MRAIITPRRPPKVAALQRILLTPSEAAIVLGMSASSLNTLTRKGIVPSLLLGSLRRYSPTALQKWAEAASQERGGVTAAA